LDFCENFGDIRDLVQGYEDGKMTAEAKAIYEAILENGPLDTVRLRREARMSAQSAKSRFDRALVELQVGLKVLPVGVAQAGAWDYAFVYELLPRWFPEIPEQARSIGRREARRVLVICPSERAESARPSSATSPSVGWSSPPRRCRSVLLPEPEDPMTATNSPSSTLKSTAASASTVTSPMRYCLLMPFVSRIGI
jgi:hypothetical protein